MKTAIIELVFEEDTDDEWIREFITNMYAKNEDKINGMEYLQFPKKEILIDIHRIIRDRIRKLDEIVDVLKANGGLLSRN